MFGGGREDGAGTPELRESRRLHQAGQRLLETPRGGIPMGDSALEVSRLRVQVAGLEGERDMRMKLEKLLEVQTVQVDLQKELRVKTESLLQVEQQTTAKLRQQLDEMRRDPGRPPPLGVRDLEERAKLDCGSVVRLQLLLQSRDKHLDEMMQALRKAQSEATEAQAECDVLKHQVLVLKKDVTERTEEVERQLRSERDLRAEVFSLQGKVAQAASSHQEEARRSVNFAQTASFAEDRQRRIDQLEQQLAEEQVASKREREQLAAESEHRIVAKEQTIKHQTTTIESLTRELKEKQVEVDRLLRLGRESPLPRGPEIAGGSGAYPGGRERDKERGGLLPPLQLASPRSEDVQGQRSIESLHRQLKAKDTKIAKQSERLQAITEMLERRDQQLEELSTAKRDREKLQQKVTDLEEVMKAQPRVVTHAEAERRLIEQEQRMRVDERQVRELQEALTKEKTDKEAAVRELSALRGHLAEGASNSGALQSENVRLSRELVEVQRLLDGRTEELQRVREARPLTDTALEAPKVAALPALQRRLQRLEELDRNLARDVAVFLQEKENKIATLNSSVALLRSSVEELRRTQPVAPGSTAAGTAVTSVVATPRALQVSQGQSPPRTAADAATSPSSMSVFLRAASPGMAPRGVLGRDAFRDAASGTGGFSDARDVGTSPWEAARDKAATSPASPRGRDARTSPATLAVAPGRDVGTNTVAQDAERGPALRQPPPRTHAAMVSRSLSPIQSTEPRLSVPLIIDANLTTDDLRTLSTEDLRHELLARRQKANHLEQQLDEKKQLVLKLVEETNLCNAEVASLQQTLQQAYKAARKQDQAYEKVLEEKTEFERMVINLKKALEDQERRVHGLFSEHQRDTSGNANTDEMDKQVGWKLKVLTPRQHEIRHSVFLVLNRRNTSILDKIALAKGLAHHFAIAAARIEIVEDARLPDSAGGEGQGLGAGSLENQLCGRSPSPESLLFGTPRALTPEGPVVPVENLDEDYPAIKRDLVLVNISDAETNEAGQVSRSAVAALDVLDQVRNDMIAGRRVGPIDGITVDAVFINHGDMILPFEWPAAQAKLLLREGRVLAGKHAVITVHEVRDPYILRIVAYDTEVGREFVLYLNTRDVHLLLDTRDGEVTQQQDGIVEGPPVAALHRHLEGPSVKHFRDSFSVADSQLLDVIVCSLSFSVWQGQQILVASEMRIPTTHQQQSQLQPQQLVLAQEPTKQAIALREVAPAHAPLALEAPPALPVVGVTRGARPKQVETKRLFEDVLGFEGRLCVFSLLHTTTPELKEDLLRAVVYYPKTCAQVEATLHQPMLADRLRIVAEAGELDRDDAFCVAIVAEEIIYPPAFVVRLTSVSLEELHSVSPQEASKPHSHVIRITKDGQNAMHLPDVSFAVTNSTVRTKLLRCIGLMTPVEGSRETLLRMPPLEAAAGHAGEETLVRRAVSGHVSERAGLTLHVVTARGRPSSSTAAESAGTLALTQRGAAAVPPALRAQLRAKHGKGKLLVRHGRTLGLHGGEKSDSIRAVVSVYERSQPYQHFVICAYEPQTSREWEMLADSIDIFKLFAEKGERRSQALDLGNPATREHLARVLVECAELDCKADEFVLVLPPAVVREHLERNRQKQRVAALPDRSKEPEVTGGEVGGGDSGASDAAGSNKPRALLMEDFEVTPAATNVQTRAVGGMHGDYDRGEDLVVEQRGRDRLFTAQRRLAPQGRGHGDLYKISIYDTPMSSTLHSYTLVATPVDASPLQASGLPTAILAHPAAVPPQKSQLKTYSLRIDDKVLEDFLWDGRLLEPSHQEELLNYISQNLHLDEDRSGQLRLGVRKKKLRTHQIPHALANVGETGGSAPAMVGQGGPGSHTCREIGGSFPLNALRLITGSSKAANSSTGPSLYDGDHSEAGRRLMVRGWKKVCSMAQRFGSSTIIVTVSKRDLTYKLGVYDPESSALYEMSLVTCGSSTPMNVLVERCDLGGKLDLMLCLHEVAFPHQLTVAMVHIPSSQEFNLKIGDDLVYSMVENSRRDAFMLYFEQLITWGCIGFSVVPGTEDHALATIFEETFAGNQIFDRTQVEDVLQKHLVATAGDGGELKKPMALPPEALRKIRVPVVRTQLDFLGKKSPPPAGINMHLLYQGEHTFPTGGQTLLLRVHKRVTTNDLAVTLRLRGEEGLSLPRDAPHRARLPQAAASSASGRPFETPAMAASEAGGVHPREVTVWLQDKCSRAPYGAYGEFCEVPGLPKPVLLLITDEDAPRAIRICATLAQSPFNVLFQVVLLETSESSAKVEAAATQKASSSRSVMQQTFQRYFGKKGVESSAVGTHLNNKGGLERHQELRQKLDNLLARDGLGEHLGIEHGPGTGGPTTTSRDVAQAHDQEVHVSILYMCTRRKMGRMMVFTIHRDTVAQNMYIRVVMHDPVSQKDCHLTLLHYTTQTLLSVLRINRDMLEDGLEMESDYAKQERQTLRAELGRLIVDHLYLQRTSDWDGQGDEIDDLEFRDDEEVDYVLRMRDIMDSSNSAQLTAKRKLLAADNQDAPALRGGPTGVQSIASASMTSLRTLPLAVLSQEPIPPRVEQPKTLLDMKEDALVHKAQKEVSGRRVLITFYNETTPEDVMRHSHNIRIVVACVQTMKVLTMEDFHEDKLELICARRGKRHLMSATREQELVRELWECLVLQHVGQEITGVTFGGLES